MIQLVHYCLSKNNSVSSADCRFCRQSAYVQYLRWPRHEDSNAYLDIKKRPTTLNLGFQFGVPKAVLGIAGPLMQNPPNQCYMQNAAIAWKQPNGFYYPPTFPLEEPVFR